jgi:hypothetical protein
VEYITQKRGIYECVSSREICIEKSEKGEMVAHW